MSPLTPRAGCWSHSSTFPAASVYKPQPSFTSPGRSQQQPPMTSIWTRGLCNHPGGPWTSDRLDGENNCLQLCLPGHPQFLFPERKMQRFLLLQHVGGFHNESGRKITDGTSSVNVKLPLELKHKAGSPREVQQTQSRLPVSLSTSHFCLTSPGFVTKHSQIIGPKV